MRPRAFEIDPTASPSFKANAKVIVVQIVVLAVPLVVVGLFMEYLRNAGVLPWSAP